VAEAGLLTAPALSGRDLSGGRGWGIVGLGAAWPTGVQWEAGTVMVGVVR